MKRRIYGKKDHSEVAFSLYSLAQVYEAQGRLDDSLSLLAELFAMYGSIHGDHASESG